MHRSAYHRIGRWILSGAFLVGWILSAQVDIAPAVLAMLVSFVAGGAVLMIIQDEFSESNDNSYAAFLIAVLLYGSLLLVFWTHSRSSRAAAVGVKGRGGQGRRR